MNLPEIRGIVAEIAYKDWRIDIIATSGFGHLQLRFITLDAETRLPEVQRGRKWQLSPHMTRSEIVQTAFLAIMTAEEHEIRERFRYRDSAIFGPHLDVDALLSIHGNHDSRIPAVPQN